MKSRDGLNNGCACVLLPYITRTHIHTYTDHHTAPIRTCDTLHVRAIITMYLATFASHPNKTPCSQPSRPSSVLPRMYVTLLTALLPRYEVQRGAPTQDDKKRRGGKK